ncbi:MAG: ATP-binding protein [Chloroflexi bacterium]|nr:ATP-binding protein [Chloroflexota bacterium]
MHQDFIGRKRELNLLTRLSKRKSPQFLILYGRRRIGKTHLIQHWANSQEQSQRILYWMATQTSTTRQLRSFSQALFRFSNPQSHITTDFSYQSWETAFAQVAQMSKQEHLILILDEFTYVMQADSEVPSIMQKMWDHHWQQSNLFLILTGSLAGIIQRTTLDYHAPLYGRATARLKLQPLPFGALSQFLPNMSTEQRIAIYALAGGIPAYIKQFDDSLTIRENLNERLLSPANIMLNDAVFLLREQLNEPRNYMAIIETIAAGFHRLTNIAKMAGMATNHVTKYLAILRELGYVQRIVPATIRRPEQSKQGRYVLSDPYLRFYYRFLQPHLGEIEYGRVKRVVDYLETHLIDYIGTYTFEELCREWINIKVDLDEFAFLPERVGSFWSRQAQVDVVALNWRTKDILLGECKWGRQVQGRKVVDMLMDKTSKVVPRAGDWTVRYAFFTRQTLTKPAQERANKVNALQISPAVIEQDILRWMEQS